MDFLKEALKDKEVQEFTKNLSKEEIELNVLLLYQQAKQNKICQACQGKDVCKSDVEYMKSTLEKTNNLINRVYDTCPYKEIINDGTLDIMFFPQTTLEEEVYVSEARDAIFHEIQRVKEGSTKGIYLHGSFGTGKTYLMMSLAKYLSRKGKKVIFAYYPELVRKVKSSIGDGTLERMISNMKTIDVLMLDDVGGEMNTAFIRDEFLGPILQHRMVNHLLTCMTSNYDINLLQEHFSGTKDESNPLKASRLMERILFMMNVVFLKDQNYRR